MVEDIPRCATCKSDPRTPVQLPCCLSVLCRLCAFKGLSKHSQRCWLPACESGIVKYDDLKALTSKSTVSESETGNQTNSSSSVVADVNAYCPAGVSVKTNNFNEKDGNIVNSEIRNQETLDKDKSYERTCTDPNEPGTQQRKKEGHQKKENETKEGVKDQKARNPPEELLVFDSRTDGQSTNKDLSQITNLGKKHGLKGNKKVCRSKTESKSLSGCFLKPLESDHSQHQSHQETGGETSSIEKVKTEGNYQVADKPTELLETPCKSTNARKTTASDDVGQDRHKTNVSNQSSRTSSKSRKITDSKNVSCSKQTEEKRKLCQNKSSTNPEKCSSSVDHGVSQLQNIKDQNVEEIKKQNQKVDETSKVPLHAGDAATIKSESDFSRLSPVPKSGVVPVTPKRKGNLQEYKYIEGLLKTSPGIKIVGLSKKFGGDEEYVEQLEEKFYDGDIIVLAILDVQVLCMGGKSTYSQIGMFIKILGLEESDNQGFYTSFYPIKPPTIGDLSFKVYTRLLEKLRVRWSKNNPYQFIKSSEWLVECVAYETALSEIVEELRSFHFSSGVILAYNSERLVFPLVSDILVRLGEMQVGFIHLQELIKETLDKEDDNLLRFCQEAIQHPFDLRDAQDSAKVLFELLSELIFVTYDNLIAPYCQYKSSLVSSDAWIHFSPQINIQSCNNIRLLNGFQEELFFELNVKTGEVETDTLPHHVKQTMSTENEKEEEDDNDVNTEEDRSTPFTEANQDPYTFENSPLTQTDNQPSQGLRINTAIFRDVQHNGQPSSEKEEDDDEEMVLIPRESDTCLCDTLALCKECRCFQVISVSDGGGDHHSGTVLCQIQDDEEAAKDKYVRYIDSSSFNPDETRASVVNQICEVISSKYLVLAVSHEETRLISPATLMGICQLWKGPPIRKTNQTSSLLYDGRIESKNIPVLRCSLEPRVLQPKVPVYIELKAPLTAELHNRLCTPDSAGHFKILIQSHNGVDIEKLDGAIGEASTRLNFDLPTQRRKQSQVNLSETKQIRTESKRTASTPDKSPIISPKKKLKFGIKRHSPYVKKNFLAEAEVSSNAQRSLKSRILQGISRLEQNAEVFSEKESQKSKDTLKSRLIHDGKDLPKASRNQSTDLPSVYQGQPVSKALQLQTTISNGLQSVGLAQTNTVSTTVDHRQLIPVCAASLLYRQSHPSSNPQYRVHTVQHQFPTPRPAQLTTAHSPQFRGSVTQRPTSISPGQYPHATLTPGLPVIRAPTGSAIQSQFLNYPDQTAGFRHQQHSLPMPVATTPMQLRQQLYSLPPPPVPYHPLRPTCTPIQQQFTPGNGLQQIFYSVPGEVFKHAQSTQVPFYSVINVPDSKFKSDPSSYSVQSDLFRGDGDPVRSHGTVINASHTSDRLHVLPGGTGQNSYTTTVPHLNRYSSYTTGRVSSTYVGDQISVVSLSSADTKTCANCTFDSIEDVRPTDESSPCSSCPVLKVRLLENPTLLAGKPVTCTVRVDNLVHRGSCCYIKLFTRSGVLSYPLFSTGFPPPNHKAPVLVEVNNSVFLATLVNHSLQTKLLRQGTVVAAAQQVFLNTNQA